MRMAFPGRTGLALAACLAAALPSAAQTPSAAPPAQSAPAPAPEQPPQAAGQAQPDAAFAAFQRGQYIGAIREALDRIGRNSNDAPAMTLLGVIYQQGLGVTADQKAAAIWFRRAHERGDVNGTFLFAMATLKGEGVERNEGAGRVLLEQAIMRGHALAAYNLALLLIPSDQFNDQARAAALLRQAANQEVPDAQYALAVLHRQGRGVGASDAEAVNLLRRAVRNGHRDALVDLGIMTYNGEGTAKDEAAGADLLRRAAYRGSAIAQNRYARILAIGRGRPQDRVEAASWHLQAARQGLADAWLDQTLADLSTQQRAEAERRAATRLIGG